MSKPYAFVWKKNCLWNRSLNSGNVKGVDMGWDFLAQSWMRLCTELEWRADLGENWHGKLLPWISSQKWFRTDLQSSSRGHKEGVARGGERWGEAEGRQGSCFWRRCQDTPGRHGCSVDHCVYAICQDQIMETAFLRKVLPNDSL